MLRLPINGGNWRFATQRTRTYGDRRTPLRSLALLRATVGSQWPGWQHQHPLARQYFTVLQGGSPEGIYLLTCALECWRAQDRASTQAVVRRLAQAKWSDYEGAALELRMAAACLRQHDQAKLLAVRGGGDIEAVFDGRPVRIECKVLQPRLAEDAFSALLQRTLDASVVLHEQGRVAVRFTGTVSDAIVSENELLGALATIAEDPRRFHRTFRGVELDFYPGEPWGPSPFENGAAIDTHGSQGDHLDLVKLRAMLRSHAYQLRGSAPGVFVAQVRSLLDGTTQPEALERHIVDGIRGIPHVSAVVCVQGDYLLGGETTAFFNKARTWWWLAGGNAVGLRHAALLVRNSGAVAPLSDAEVVALLSAWVRS